MTEPKTKHYKKEKEEKESKEDEFEDWGDTRYVSDEEKEEPREKSKVEQGYTWD